MSEEILDPTQIASFKRKFNNQLEPIKVMLVHLKEGMSSEEWINVVVNTKQSILNHPDQYLGSGLPNKVVIEFVIQKIFEDFLNREMY